MATGFSPPKMAQSHTPPAVAATPQVVKRSRPSRAGTTPQQQQAPAAPVVVLTQRLDEEDGIVTADEHEEHFSHDAESTSIGAEEVLVVAAALKRSKAAARIAEREVALERRKLIAEQANLQVIELEEKLAAAKATVSDPGSRRTRSHRGSAAGSAHSGSGRRVELSRAALELHERATSALGKRGASQLGDAPHTPTVLDPTVKLENTPQGDVTPTVRQPSQAEEFDTPQPMPSFSIADEVVDTAVQTDGYDVSPRARVSVCRHASAQTVLEGAGVDAHEREQHEGIVELRKEIDTFAEAHTAMEEEHAAQLLQMRDNFTRQLRSNDASASARINILHAELGNEAELVSQLRAEHITSHTERYQEAEHLAQVARDRMEHFAELVNEHIAGLGAPEDETVQQLREEHGEAIASFMNLANARHSELVAQAVARERESFNATLGNARTAHETQIHELKAALAEQMKALTESSNHAVLSSQEAARRAESEKLQTHQRALKIEQEASETLKHAQSEEQALFEKCRRAEKQSSCLERSLQERDTRHAGEVQQLTKLHREREIQLMQECASWRGSEQAAAQTIATYESLVEKLVNTPDPPKEDSSKRSAPAAPAMATATRTATRTHTSVPTSWTAASGSRPFSSMGAGPSKAFGSRGGPGGDGPGDDPPKGPGLPKSEEDRDEEKGAKGPKKEPGGGGGGGGGGDDPDGEGGGGGDSGSSDEELRALSPEQRALVRAFGGSKTRKEQDKITLNPMPTPQQYRSWRLSTIQKVVAASGRGHRAFQWIMAVEDVDFGFEALGYPGREYKSLDAKLAAAITETATGELGRQLTHRTEVEMNAGRLITGRQLLWIMQEYFRLNEEAGAVYEVQDLMAVKFKDDNHMEQFIATWDHVLAGMRLFLITF